jgi:RNA-directed DNA polymerase
MLASKKHGLAGRRWTTRFKRQWLHDLGTYQLTGTVRYGSAHAGR